MINNNYLFNFIMKHFPYEIDNFCTWEKIEESEKILKSGQKIFVGFHAIKMINGKYKVVDKLYE